MEFIVGLLVSIIFIVAYGTQIKTLFKSKDLSGVSLWFWVFIVTPVTFTFIHLVSSGAEWHISIPQLINAVLGLFILSFVSLMSKNLLKVLLFWVMMVIIILSPTIFSIPYDIVQNVSTTMIIIAYIVQIVKFKKLETSAGTDLFLYLFFALGMSILLAQMIITHVPLTVIVTESSNILLLLVCASLNLKYKQK